MSQLAIARLYPATWWWGTPRGTVGVAPSFAIFVLVAQGGAQGDVRMWQLLTVLDDIVAPNVRAVEHALSWGW